jgi:hypothetical protein
MALIQVLASLYICDCEGMHDSAWYPSINEYIIFQIPGAAVGVFLTDRSGRRPLLLVRMAMSQL